MSTYLGVNVNETMESIRYLMNKYKWMAADIEAPMPKAGVDIVAQTPISKQEREEIANLRSQGLSVKEISEKTGRSQPSVYTVLRASGISNIPQRKIYSLEFRAKAVAQVRAGRTCSQVANELKCSEKSVRSWYLHEEQNKQSAA